MPDAPPTAAPVAVVPPDPDRLLTLKEVAWPVRFADIARAVLDAAMETTARPVTLTVRRRRVDLLVLDHRVVVEVVRGVLRIV